MTAIVGHRAPRVRRLLVSCVTTALLAGTALAVVAPAAHAAPPPFATNEGEFSPVPPTRVVDSRTGTVYDPFVGPLGPTATHDVPVTAACVPAPSAGEVSAVAMNVTAVSPTASSWLTVYPKPARASSPPVVSNLNVVAGQTVPNHVIVPVGDADKVRIYNQFGSVHVVVDIVGCYWSATSDQAGYRYRALAPQRILDTRAAIGIGTTTPLGPMSITSLSVGTGSPVPGNATAAVMNVTVTGPNASGWLTVFPSDLVTPPTASNLNFVPGLTVANLVTMPLGADGKVKIQNGSPGTVHVIADVVGYYVDNHSGDTGRFVPTAPTRIADTRNPASFGPYPLPANVLVGLPVTGVDKIPSSPLPATGVMAVVGNLTVTSTTASSWLTAAPADVASIPNISNLNWAAGATVPNLAVVKVSIADSTLAIGLKPGSIGVVNAIGSTHVIADVFGWFAA